MVSYTTVSPLPLSSELKNGGLLSVALVPRIAPGGNYPQLCPLESGLSSVYFYNAVIRATLLESRIEQSITLKQTNLGNDKQL